MPGYFFFFLCLGSLHLHIDASAGTGGGGSSRSRDGDDLGGESSVSFYFPTRDCAKIIGRGRSKIHELQERSGCRIIVGRSVEGNDTRRVELSGSDDAIDKAIDLINQLLEAKF